jgi:uncharacterized membrane protein
MKKFYDEETETLMVYFYESLNEKNRRHYAAVEALKLGYGGVLYISILFKVSVRTIERGMADMKKKDITS